MRLLHQLLNLLFGKTYLVRWLPLLALSVQKVHFAAVLLHLIVVESAVAAGWNGEGCGRRALRQGGRWQVGRWQGGRWQGGRWQGGEQHGKADQGDQHMHLD